MLLTIFFFLIILAIISIAFPPIGAIIFQALTMPVRIVFADMKISGSVLAVLIILIALEMVKF
jgi:hypothetical protein